MKHSKQVGVISVTVLITFLFLCCTFPSVTAQDSCSQKADPGICRASIPRFYFNSRIGRCDSFLYGGCGGNANNFRNMGECNSFRDYCLRRRGGRF